MMAVRPCYRSDVSLNDVLAAKQDEQRDDESEKALSDAYDRAAALYGESEGKRINAILNR